MNQELRRDVRGELLLQLKSISVQFDGVRALTDVSVSIDEGEMVALLGPNGAGKSTVFKVIFGLVPFQEGSIYFHEQVLKPRPHWMVLNGVSLVPQGRRVFTRLTVKENLQIGGVTARGEYDSSRRMHEVLDLFPVLKRKYNRISSELSGGEQQMLALARGLMTDPKILLLDEPTLGLAPKVVAEPFSKICEINLRHRTAIFIVEHNIQSVLNIVHRGYVLESGRLVYEGSAEDIRKSAVLEKVFFGIGNN